MNRTIESLAVVAFAGLLGTSCQTVSDQAPREIQAAEKSIENAQKEDLDNTMPAAMELSERKLARSLELLDDAADYRAKGQADQADTTEKQAIILANEAKAIVDMGLNIQRDAKKFDENLTEYIPLHARAEQAATMEGQLTELKKQNAALTAQNGELTASMAPKPEATIPENFRIAKPVAYFSSGSTKIQARYRSELQEVADALKNNPELYLTLEGYADPRGSAELNQKLAEERAAAVSNFLEEKGVQSSRIKVEIIGATADSATGQSKGDLQLDRKVVAKFKATAH